MLWKAQPTQFFSNPADDRNKPSVSKHINMKRNVFLFLLLFLFTLTASIVEMAKHNNIQNWLERVKSIATSSADQGLETEAKAGSSLQDEHSPMILHFTLISKDF
jgi:hypothetical protein